MRGAAYGVVAKAAEWAGLGCLQVALKKAKEIHHIYLYMYIHSYTHHQFLGGSTADELELKTAFKSIT